MATRSGRKWLGRLTLTNQVTPCLLHVTTEPRRALSLIRPRPSFPFLTTDTDLEQWPLQIRQETPPHSAERTN